MDTLWGESPYSVLLLQSMIVSFKKTQLFLVISSITLLSLSQILCLTELHFIAYCKKKSPFSIFHTSCLDLVLI